jgi:hypothetical protein
MRYEKQGSNARFLRWWRQYQLGKNLTQAEAGSPALSSSPIYHSYMREEFALQVKEILAKRVAFRCSNPSCRQPTTDRKMIPKGHQRRRSGQSLLLCFAPLTSMERFLATFQPEPYKASGRR